MGDYNITELKLHLADSTFKQAVGIKENIVVQIRGSPALLDLVIVDMPEDPSAGVEREPPRDAGVDDGGVAYERHASMLDRRSPMRSIFLSLQASFSTRVPLRG